MKLSKGEFNMNGRQISFKVWNNLMKHSDRNPKGNEMACFLKSFSKYFTENNVNGR